MKNSLFKTISTVFLIFCTQNVFASTWASGDVNLLKLSIKCSSNAYGDKPWNSSITAVATEFTIQGNRFWSGSGKHTGDTGQHIFTGHKTDESLTITAIGKWLLKSNTWDLYFISRGKKTMHQHLKDGIPGYEGRGQYRRDCEIKLLNSIPVASAIKSVSNELDIQAETMKLSRKYDKRIADLKKEISDSKNNLEFETKFNEINKENEDMKNELSKVQQEKSSFKSKNLALNEVVKKLETNYQDLEIKHKKVQQSKSSLEGKNKDLNQELNIFKKKEAIEIKRKEYEETEKLFLIQQNKERVKEEDRKREERKINNIKYELISSKIVVAQNFIRDLEEFVKSNPSEFDIIEIAELLIESKDILSGDWNEALQSSFLKLKNYSKKSNNFNQYKIKKEEERYITALSQLNSEYELLLSNQKELESKLNENLTSDFAPPIIEKVKIIRSVLNNYTLKLLKSTNFEIDIFKKNLSKQIEEKRFEEENKVIEIRKSKTNLMKLKQLLVENLTNDYSQPIIENINKINKLNYDTLNSHDILTSNLSIQNFIYELENGTLLENTEPSGADENDQSNSKSYKGGGNLFSDFLNTFNLSISNNLLELTCEDVVNQVKNQKLLTLYGSEIAMLYFDKVSLVVQNEDEILCKSYITTSNAVEAWYNIRLFKRDEDIFYDVKASN